MAEPTFRLPPDDPDERLAWVCAEIKDDMERDVAAFDGCSLDGRVVAEIHGTLAATCSALAGMVSVLHQRIVELEARRG